MTAPGASSSTSRIGSWQDPSWTVTLTFTSRTRSRVLSSMGAGGRRFFGPKFFGKFHGDAIAIETDCADKFGRSVEGNAGILENIARHFDHIANAQVDDLTKREFESRPLRSGRNGDMF